MELEPGRILVLGGQACLSLLGTDKITSARGRYYDWKGIPTIPTYHPNYLLKDPNLFRDFTKDVEKLHAEPGWVTYPYLHGEGPEVEWVFTVEKALALLGSFKGTISIDIEATAFEPEEGEIISVGFSLSGDKAYIFMGSLFYHPGVKKAFDRLVTNKLNRIVCQNAGYEYTWFLFKMGIRMVIANDTMLNHYVIDERSGGDEEGETSNVKSFHNLKLLAGEYFDLPDYSKELDQYLGKGKTYADVPLPTLFKYQALDCTTTYLLDGILQAKAEEEGTLGVLNTVLLPAVPVVAEVEKVGVKIDRAYLETLSEVWQEEIDAGVEEIRRVTNWPDLNIRSPKQVAELIYDRLQLKGVTALDSSRHFVEGGRSTAAGVLTKLYEETGNEVLKLILETRNKAQNKSTYIDGFLKRIEKDGRIRTHLMLFGTDTGRLCSRNPNLQNIPGFMGPIVRRAFVASPGWTFLEVDYSQLELRVAALYSQDPTFIETFQSGKDIHGEVAVKMFKKPADKITKPERYAAKCLNFGIAYGRGANSVSEQLELPKKYRAMLNDRGRPLYTESQAEKAAIKEAQQYIDTWLGQFPRFKEWMHSVQTQAKEVGYVTCPNGRKRRFPFITQQTAGEVSRQAINSPIQGYASDICLGNAMVKVHRALDPTKARILLPVHDSILLEVRPKYIDEVKAQVVSIMEKMPFESVIPFKVDCKVAQHWGEMGEYSDEQLAALAAVEARLAEKLEPKTTSKGDKQ
jgi:DNA polymerase I